MWSNKHTSVMPIAATVEHDDDIADAFRALSIATHDAPPAPLENAYHRLIPDIIHARSAPIAQPVTAFNAPSRGQVGMARLDAVVRNVNIIASTVLDRPITKNQQTIVTQFILVCLPTIVTPAEYVQYRDEYYIYLGIDPSEINVPVPADQPTSQTSASHQFRDTRLGGSLMPRQCGKTTIIAICCAAILVACPCVTIGNFASQLQQAEIMQEQIAKNIRCFQDKCTPRFYLPLFTSQLASSPANQNLPSPSATAPAATPSPKPFP
jgi:hypothetical protein